jgi:hypothetical protein
MEAPQQPTGSPGAFMNGLEQGFAQSYGDRLRGARKGARADQDASEVERICSARTLEERMQRMAEFRRGRWYQLGAICTSAVAGVGLGMVAQGVADVRVAGVPVMGVLGLGGIAAGAAIDESLTTRAFFAVGGTMFTIGTIAYAYMHPLPAVPDAQNGGAP